MTSIENKEIHFFDQPLEIYIQRGKNDQTKERHLQYNTIEARQESEKILRQAYQLEELGLALKEAANSNGQDHIIYTDDHGAECICLDGKSGFEYDPSQDYLVTKTA